MTSKLRPFLRKLKRIWVATGLVVSVLFVGYMLVGFRPNRIARASLASDASVEVSRRPDGFTFRPLARERAEAVLLFAGALVDPGAYAPLMRRLAQRGHGGVVLSLPARTAPTRAHREQAISRALEIIAASPGHAWVVGGHSKGGVIAAELAHTHPESLAGLLLVGTSHPRDFSLSTLERPVLKVYGTRDGLASEEEVHQFASNLPSATRFVEIAGGNHAQFGYYGYQLGDRRATITREEQQEQLLEAITDFLDEIAATRGAAP
jgi:pimeloyl-ACP methyl ester carboxylesterase